MLVLLCAIVAALVVVYMRQRGTSPFEGGPPKARGGYEGDDGAVGWAPDWRGDGDDGDVDGADPDEDYVDGGGSFRLRLRDPAYTQALEGKKTVEGRLDKPPFNRLKVGDTFVVARSRPQGDTAEYAGARRFAAQVRHVKKYPTYAALLEGEGLKAVAPGAKSAAAATAAWREFTPEEAETSQGLIGIAFERKD